MVARVETVAFQGIDVLTIVVQVQVTSGLPAFTIVGLPDKAVAESRERVRGALHALGLGLPPKRITVNLAPADVAKEGSHFDLPIALGLMVALEILPADAVADRVALGELALDGAISPVAGVLPAAVDAAARSRGLICPADCGPEAAWAADESGPIEVLAPPSLLALVNHIKGSQVLAAPTPRIAARANNGRDLSDIRGQETAKRALEIAAAGGHNMLMVGPPGAGKSMLAARLPGLLPPLTPAESLEVSMVHSVAGLLPDGGILRERPFRDPHHSASLPALVGGGQRAKPGEISLAHRGVLFLDELPEFSKPTLEALRQPLETGRTVIARANHHVAYPGPSPVDRRHEPVPLRLSGRRRSGLQPRAALCRGISVAPVRPASGSDRHPCRCRRRAASVLIPRPARRSIRRRRRARGRRPQPPSRPRWKGRTLDQCRSRWAVPGPHHAG